MSISQFLESLRAKLDPDQISEDQETRITYGRDWTKIYRPNPSAVLFPRSTAEVSEILKQAAQHGVPIVPSGGRTGLSGGAVAMNQEVVLSLERMRRIGTVDPLAMTLEVEAGAITESVHQACAPFGLTWPVDFASKGSSQVGGNIATNAGGVKVLRYGLTRQWVLGLKVVLMGGEVLELNGALEKNNTGLDLRQLFIGSEGILGVVTEAILKLAPLPKESAVALFALNSLPSVMKFFGECRRGPFQISAYEMFTQNCLKRVQKNLGVKAPFAQNHSHYVLLEFEVASEELAAEWLEPLLEQPYVKDAILAQSPKEARELWSLRESISESLASTGFPHKNDLALPVAQIEEFCGEFEAWMAESYPGFEICLFGHIGDGNLHVNILKPEEMSMEDFRRETAQVDPALFSKVQTFHGSISAEHGIGLLKKPYLTYSRAPEEIALMRSLKQMWDPKNLLNPGKIFDFEGDKL
jgi:FAD/FMN-containing dehydrogenase